MADIIVDTYKLNQYAQRISEVNRRISRLDQRLNTLYTRVGLQGLWNLMQADALTCYSWRLNRCRSYLQETATDFERTEQDILRQDPEKFKDVFVGYIYSNALHMTGDNSNNSSNKPSDKSNVSLWNIIKDELTSIPEDAKSAGEALSWIEKQYGKLPNWVTLGVDVLVPGSLRDAYTLTSELLQGEITLDGVWKVFGNISSSKTVILNNPKFAIIYETLNYTFETGIQRYEEMERQIYEQLGEGDIFGAVFDGAEGFIDTIIGGSVDVLGNVGGSAVDAFIDNIPIVKEINMLTEYGTGLLGCNDGEGYSVGGLISYTTGKITEGLDMATDFITDTADYITDAVTDGFKSGIDWVKGLFD